MGPACPGNDNRDEVGVVRAGGGWGVLFPRGRLPPNRRFRGQTPGNRPQSANILRGLTSADARRNSCKSALFEHGARPNRTQEVAGSSPASSIRRSPPQNAVIPRSGAVRRGATVGQSFPVGRRTKRLGWVLVKHQCRSSKGALRHDEMTPVAPLAPASIGSREHAPCDRGAIKALSTPDIVEAYRGPEAPPRVAVGELPPDAITWWPATATRSRLSESAALRLRCRLDVRSM